MVSASFMVDTSSHPRAQLHRCVERSAYDYCEPPLAHRWQPAGSIGRLVHLDHGGSAPAQGLHQDSPESWRIRMRRGYGRFQNYF
ncbi:hypothetical protein ABIF66_002646 [Bradyrhizobium japonicum]